MKIYKAIYFVRPCRSVLEGGPWCSEGCNWRSWVLVASASLPGVRLPLHQGSGKGCKLDCQNLSAWGLRLNTITPWWCEPCALGSLFS